MSLLLINQRGRPATLPHGFEVKEGHWASSEEADVLYTREVGACIAVASYNISRQLGHLAHIKATAKGQDEVLPALTSSLARTTNPSDTIELWVAGGAAPESVSQHLLALERRDRVLRTLQCLDLPFSSIVPIWNDEEGPEMDVTLDCTTGLCVVTTVYGATPLLPA